MVYVGSQSHMTICRVQAPKEKATTPKQKKNGKRKFENRKDKQNLKL